LHFVAATLQSPLVGYLVDRVSIGRGNGVTNELLAEYGYDPNVQVYGLIGAFFDIFFL
jgi:hypothetical protein